MQIKNPFLKNNVIILAPLILVTFLDFVFTLAGQPASYWQSFNLSNEASPLGFSLLSQNPIYFILFFIFYLLLILFLSVNLPRPFNIMIWIGFFLGHSWGSASWLSILSRRYPSIYIDDWYLTIGYFIFVAIVAGFCLNKWLKNKSYE